MMPHSLLRTVSALLLSMLLTAASGCAQTTLDLKRGILSNDQITVHLPKVGARCDVALEYRGTTVSPRQWYYLVGGDLQSGSHTFRSTGPVIAVEPLETGPRAGVRIRCHTDDPVEPDVGVFELEYHIEQGSPVVRHSMTFTPRRPLALSNYQYFVTTPQARAESHRLHSFVGEELTSVAARTTAAYGRMGFSTDPAFVALENRAANHALAVGVPSADLTDLQYSIEFQRFEVGRKGGYVTPERPLEDYAMLGVGPDVAALAALFEQFRADVSRAPRQAETALPAVDLTQEGPGAPFETGASGSSVSCRDLRATLDPRTGALTSLQGPSGELLGRPGGIVFVEWPRRDPHGPEGTVIGLRARGDRLTWRWLNRGLRASHELRASAGRLEWKIDAANLESEQRLVELRLELPLAIDRGHLWDGMRLVDFAPGDPNHEMTTLVPGAKNSQGIFPAVCAHSADAGVAVGMQPMHIESFYGARLESGPRDARTLSYVVRWALPANTTRTARFVLYTIDPRWSWRSCVARYWEAWPEVFAAPAREDVWGLWSASSPAQISAQGDTFIERCRRLRVGAMELYAPFTRTGDFYPDGEPVFQRDNATLNRDQMRRVQDTANIASCNISYVIPTKCERGLARSRYLDSIIRLSDGSLFMLDSWAVMQGEKLAAMFAWGNSFGESLLQEIGQILADYAPEGFYFDNGAFVWEDYGRETQWAAFDDQGRVYANAGIPYAMIQDELARTRPSVHRNPGEYIQYFSGFRAHSHLSNSVNSQRFYVRSHRLIMGYKPIFPGHPRFIQSRQEIYDYLEFGGLPWLVGMRHTGERLAQAWAPIAIELARAGWRPITDAFADSPDVRVERFGGADGKPTLLTVRNTSRNRLTATITIRGELPGLADYFGRQRIQPQVAGGLTTVRVELGEQEMAFLTTDPPRRESDLPVVAFLRDAQPVSIVLPAQPSAAEERMARRVGGFVQLQAEMLSRQAQLEVARGAAPAHPNRVTISESAGSTRIQLESADRLTIVFSDESDAVRALSDLLDLIAKPMSDEQAQWVP